MTTFRASFFWGHQLCKLLGSLSVYQQRSLLKAGLGKHQAADLVASGGTKFWVERRAASSKLGTGGAVAFADPGSQVWERLYQQPQSVLGRESPVSQLVQVEHCQSEMGLSMPLSQRSCAVLQLFMGSHSLQISQFPHVPFGTPRIEFNRRNWKCAFPYTMMGNA